MIKANESVFPTIEYQKINEVEVGRAVGGLTKLEIFAMAAMQGMIAGMNYDKERSLDDISKIPITTAKNAVYYAKAMLSELEKEQ